MKFNYKQDKETKNTIRYRPEGDAAKLMPEATIYIPNTALEKIGIKSGDDIIITIEKK